mmetsp:Transcript_1673/g.1825  ORF Transcript_1673/g.1825 Transcript_1673/m.1825 type:complete len:369 (-) Transcript_1673:49-1155(-)
MSYTMILTLYIVACLCCLQTLNAFTPVRSTHYRRVSTGSISKCLESTASKTVLNMALASSASLLVRKGKMKENALLQANVTAVGENHAINVFLKDGTRPPGIGNPVDFFKSTASRFQSISVLPEFSRKAKTGFVIELPPPEIIGGVLRDAGSRGIMVSLDKRSGGATVDEFRRFTVEQTRARILTPTPIPIVWCDFIVEDLQIINAATHGAAAITLSPEMTSDLKAQVDLCHQYKIEPIAMIKTVEEGLAAIAAGARVMCLHSLEEAALQEIRSQLPSSPDYLYGARLRPEADYSLYAEIDTTWVLRDHDFNFVWPSPEAVYSTGMGDIYSSILAMRSKASRQFLSPRQFLMDRKKEGAQEYLGDILY